MQKRIIQAGLAGMNQDVINPKVNTQYAYEIKNFRINSTGHSNGIELTSEKGTYLVPIKYNNQYIDDVITISVNNEPADRELELGHYYEVIGHCVLNQYLTLFIYGWYLTRGENDTIVTNPNDCIVRLEFNDDETEFNAVLLYHGNLGFDNNHKIECVPYMESTDIQKVYWIDGINYPRVINIVREGGYTDFDEDEDPFSFYQKISSGGYNTIDVEKTYVGGLFYAGVIQYAFSFYNKNAQETPIIYTTPLNYISHSDRGEVANKQLGCAFDVTVKINIEDHDNFEYVRVYSIYRSSINGTPVVKVIKDTKCDDFTDNTLYYSTTFTDTNELGYDFDAYRILINSDHIKPEAIGYKDQKMFLGNYDTDSNVYNLKFVSSGSLIEWDTNSYEGYRKTVQYKKTNTDGYSYNSLIGSNSKLIKTFKYNEYYKFGLQFQDEYGVWSSPYIIDTQASQNDKKPVFSGVNIHLPYARMTQDIDYIKSVLQSNDIDANYVKVRPVVSFPSLNERTILCQGVANPTVFNISQRTVGTSYSQASWFFRPFFYTQENQSDNAYSYKWFDDEVEVTSGAYVQCKHFQPLFPSDDIGGELLNMYFDDKVLNTHVINPLNSKRPKCSAFNMESTLAVDTYLNYYYVDHSIMTLNSPEIDFQESIRNIDFGQYQIRITGYIPFNFNYSKLNIIAESPLFLRKFKVESPYTGVYCYDESRQQAYGFFDNSWGDKGLPGRIVSRLSWFDDVNGVFEYTLNSGTFVWSRDHDKDRRWNEIGRHHIYNTYPFQREYLNNYNKNTPNSTGTINSKISADDIESSRIIKKIVSNIKYADKICYFDTEQDVLTNDVKLFDYTENLFTKVDDKIYYGNVDQLITTTSVYGDFLFNGDANEYIEVAYQGYYQPEARVVQFLADETDTQGYPIITANNPYPSSSGDTFNVSMEFKKPVPMSHSFKSLDNSAIGSGVYYGWENISDDTYGSIFAITPNTSSKDPILMRYKSSPHVVFSMASSGSTLYIFPQVDIKTGGSWDNEYWSDRSNVSVPWKSGTGNWEADVFELDGFGDDYKEALFLCEMYKEPDDNYLSNSDDFNNQSRDWVVCGDTYNLEEDGTKHIIFKEGDTYFQRYDCLKTYPYSNEDYQSVVEIASFMVETHINLDGRYDENRGLIDNTFVNPTNFNLINPVYSLTNNFFQYNVLDEEDFKTTDFPTRFTWSLNKINGLDIDEWTRTNTAAFYDCDGDKGEITSLRRFNNQIYAFQDKGISRIKYNENVAINTNNGTPIELGNSLSVNGVEYLSELVGSQNKWSNISTPNGIFFTDNYTAGLYRLGGGERVLTNLTKNTLQRWFESNNANHDFINTASFDANMNEIHFMFDNQSLAYNNDFGTFTSFYDYRGMVGNIKNHSFNITGNSIYFLRESNKYNSFYGTKKPYWISFVANSNIDGYSPSNAIYDNVWYKADVLHSTKTDNFNYDELIQNTDDAIPDFLNNNTGWYETFNKIVVGNDYQYAENRNQTKNFDFIKKFRTWRVPVPRQDRARMRNSWLRIRLENTKPSYDKMILRDIYVDSFF